MCQAFLYKTDLLYRCNNLHAFSVSRISALDDSSVKPSKFTISKVTNAEFSDVFSITSLVTN